MSVETDIKQQDPPQTENKIPLTSSEVASIWQSYMNDSMAICTIMQLHVEDKEIGSILTYAMSLSQSHMNKLTSFFKEEQYPIPQGFSVEADVNKEAPRL